MPLEFRWEKLADMLRDGAFENMERQWAESGRHREAIPMRPDWPMWQAVEDAGRLKLCAARKDGALVGHAAFIVGPHLMYGETPHALNDSIYLRPEAGRGHALRMVLWCERELRAMAQPKAIRIIYSVPKNSPFNAVLERLGYAHVENVREKVLA